MACAFSKITGEALTGVTCKLTEEISDPIRYCRKGLDSGMVVVPFPEGGFGFFKFPKTNELLQLICERENIQINFQIKYSFSNPIDDQNA